MRNIPLQTIPNQSMILQLDGNSYDIRIHTCNDLNTQIMAMTLLINDEIILSGQRLVPNFPVIPYIYLENGNFVFVTMNDAYPDYNLFGISQYLIYATSSELAAFRAPAEMIGASS